VIGIELHGGIELWPQITDFSLLITDH